ncbi:MULTISPECIES: ABC-three component system middle component 6 [Leuconostoc gelidum group]|uniref:ABC-three component system middle component 6 n=1 Tax=Leuconostoc gelidum group TaxID=3016637 RepID=UPI00027E6C55|nr:MULTISPECIES: ABC-three component system middle component 6 [Leuconostoc gelidum group]AFS40248.1 hypothetical protein C269_04025 [Leuconostoc gelidum JB7]MBZ5948027.1 hypothetical protein [Leuconostoc gasicomitatum]MBZ5988182.1 hypothetical protein [Leuconostoc gasicomitatum]MBZ5990151.1 hypothetical protein [Leuconostoc gasicomitatum]
MLLLDINNNPDNTIYYLAATIYGFLNKNDGLDYIELYSEISQKILAKKINFEFFSLALDFLFLLDKVDVDEKGALHVYKKLKNN